MCVCVCVCVCERERERERGWRSKQSNKCLRQLQSYLNKKAPDEPLFYFTGPTSTLSYEFHRRLGRYILRCYFIFLIIKNLFSLVSHLEKYIAIWISSSNRILLLPFSNILRIGFLQLLFYLLHKTVVRFHLILEYQTNYKAYAKNEQNKQTKQIRTTDGDQLLR